MQQLDKAEQIVYGELQRGGLIDRLNNLEAILFGRSLPGSIAERQTALLNFLEKGAFEQPSMLFKLSIAEWAIEHRIYPSIPALGRLQKLERDLEGEIQEGKPLAMRLERVLSLLLADPVSQVEVALPSDFVMKGRFLKELGPGKSKKGDIAPIELTEDIVITGKLVAPAGSRVLAEVTEVKMPKMFGVPGTVKIQLNSVELLGPERPELLIGPEAQSADKGGKGIAGAAGASIAGAVLLGPVGLVSGILVRGNAVNIPEGALIYFQTKETVQVMAYPIPEGISGAAARSESSGDSAAQESDEFLLPSEENVPAN